MSLRATHVITYYLFSRLPMALAQSSYLGPLAQQSPVPSPRNKKAFLGSLATCIKEAWKEALADVRNRWPFFFLAVWFAGLTYLLAELGVHIHPPISACRPDGTFSPFTGYSYWDVSGIFQITLAFGSFTFTQAKVIDIAWDIVRRAKLALCL